MKLGVLFSGGKDSTLAMHYAKKADEVVCLISILSENPHSYMFHTPNISLVEKQADALGLPIVIERTKGEKERELIELERALKRAKKEHKIEGVVTGAVASVYQASRIQKICLKLKLWCFNPLWQKDQFGILGELIKKGFEVVIVGVFGEGMESFLGKKINHDFIEKMKKVFERFRVNPAGEGGEFESFVLGGPGFSKTLNVLKSNVTGKGYSKTLVIEELG